MLDVTDNSGCATASTANDLNSFHAWNGDTANLLLQNWNFCYLASYVVKLHGYGRVCWHCGLLMELRIVEMSCIRWWWWNKLKADEVCNFETPLRVGKNPEHETHVKSGSISFDFGKFCWWLFFVWPIIRPPGRQSAVRKRQRAKKRRSDFKLIRFDCYITWWDYLNTP